MCKRTQHFDQFRQRELWLKPFSPQSCVMHSMSLTKTRTGWSAVRTLVISWERWATCPRRWSWSSWVRTSTWTVGFAGLQQTSAAAWGQTRFHFLCLYSSWWQSWLWGFCRPHDPKTFGGNSWDDWHEGAQRCLQRGENQVLKLNLLLIFHSLSFLPSVLLLSPAGQFDMDGDGEITTEELRSAMIKLMGEHMCRREIDAIVKEADDNGDGTVDFEGMMAWTWTRGASMTWV